MQTDFSGQSGTYFQNGWTFYLISLLFLTALYFIQKYANLIDRKINRFGKRENGWEGKPWHLLGSLSLGLLTFLYSFFSPAGIKLNHLAWQWPEWTLCVCFAIGIGVLFIESFRHFGLRYGMIRLLLLGLLAVAFYLAGLIAGLMIVSFVAIGLLFIFINSFRKRLIKN